MNRIKTILRSSPILSRSLFVFLVYCLVIYLYALAYSWLYSIERTAFIFHPDVDARRQSELRDKVRDSFFAMIADDSIGFGTPDTSWYSSTEGSPGASVSFWFGRDSLQASTFSEFIQKYDSMNQRRAAAKIRYYLQLRPAHQIVFGNREIATTDTPAIRSLIIADYLEARTTILSRVESVFTSLASEPPLPREIRFPIRVYQYLIGSDTLAIGDRSEIEDAFQAYVNIVKRQGLYETWHFSDFLYFSSQAILGGGFGDIIPNSGASRLLTSSESVFGIFVLIVLLNIALISGTPAKNIPELLEVAVRPQPTKKIRKSRKTSRRSVNSPKMRARPKKI